MFFLKCCRFDKRIHNLEETCEILQNRIELCEKSLRISEAMISHCQTRLSFLENKEKDREEVHLEDIIETVVPQSKPIVNVVTRWFRFFV